MELYPKARGAGKCSSWLTLRRGSEAFVGLQPSLMFYPLLNPSPSNQLVAHPIGRRDRKPIQPLPLVSDDIFISLSLQSVYNHLKNIYNF